MSRNASASTRLRVAAGAAVLITVACTASAAAFDRSPGTDSPRAPREAAALTGSAKLSRTLGDDITFTFDAHLAAEHRMEPAKATGTFRFSHYLNGEGAWAKGRIDCLVTGGKSRSPPVSSPAAICRERRASGSASPCTTWADTTGWATAGP
jgi:hypothetical protein